MRRIADLAKGSLIYFFGSAANALLPLVLLPLLTRYLKPEDYGIIATANVLIQVALVLIGLNAYGLIARNYFDKDENRLANLISASTILTVILSVILLGGSWLLRVPISKFAEFPATWLPAIVFLSFATVIQNNYLSLLQARKEPFRFIANQTVSNLVNMGISVWLVVGFGMRWEGRMWALIASLFSVLLMSLWGFSGRLHLLRFSFRRDALKELLHFGVPLIPHVIGGLVLTMSARLFLNHMASIAETGLFSVAYGLASPMAMIIGAGNKAYIPALFEMLSHEETLNKRALCRWLLLACIVLLVGSVIYGLVMQLAITFLLGPKFQGSGIYLVWLSLAMAVQGVYYIFSNFVIYSKKTHLLGWRGDFLGAIVMLIMCPLLIHLMGGVGSAVATVLATAVSTFGCIWAARHAYPMPWGKAITSLIFPFQKNA
ncbi:MAG: oligosaccharide flippase family protein [Chthoniobacterales bacterium]